MALELTKETVHGVSSNYWKVSEVHINRIDNSAQVIMLLFKDKPTADARKAALEYVRYEWKGDDYPFAERDENVVAIAYTKIKSLAPEQEGGLDFRVAADV